MAGERAAPLSPFEPRAAESRAMSIPAPGRPPDRCRGRLRWPSRDLPRGRPGPPGVLVRPANAADGPRRWSWWCPRWTADQRHRGGRPGGRRGDTPWPWTSTDHWAACRDSGIRPTPSPSTQRLNDNRRERRTSRWRWPGWRTRTCRPPTGWAWGRLLGGGGSLQPPAVHRAPAGAGRRHLLHPHLAVRAIGSGPIPPGDHTEQFRAPVCSISAPKTTSCRRTWSTATGGCAAVRATRSTWSTGTTLLHEPQPSPLRGRLGRAGLGRGARIPGPAPRPLSGGRGPAGPSASPGSCVPGGPRR